MRTTRPAPGGLTKKKKKKKKPPPPKKKKGPPPPPPPGGAPPPPRAQERGPPRRGPSTADQGLMIFRLESLFFSWTEFIPVDRAGDDTERRRIRGGVRTIWTMISVFQVTARRRSSSIKFDLDLPSEEHEATCAWPGYSICRSGLAAARATGKPFRLRATSCWQKTLKPAEASGSTAPTRQTFCKRQFKRAQATQTVHKRQLDGERAGTWTPAWEGKFRTRRGPGRD